MTKISLAAVRHAVSWRAAHFLELISDKAYVLAAGPGRSLGDVHRVRTYRTLRDLAERFNLDVGTVLYVGANEGQELDLLTTAFPGARIACFEPQPELLPGLRARVAAVPGAEVHAVALSDEAGRVTFSRSASHDQASSLLVPNAQMAEHFPHVGGWQQLEVDAVRLDDWAAGVTLTDDIALKIDVQGAEGAVLAGGPGVLARTRLVVLEVAVEPTYDGAATMHELFELLRRHGFSYAGELGQVRGRTGAVVEFDAAFVRPRRPAESVETTREVSA